MWVKIWVKLFAVCHWLIFKDSFIVEQNEDTALSDSPGWGGRRRMKKKKQWVRNGLWYESITYLFSDAFHLDSWDNGWSTNLSLKHETCLWSSLFFDWLMKNVLKPSQKTCPGSLSWLECMPHVSRRVFTAAAQVWFWHGPMPSSLSVCLSLWPFTSIYPAASA